MTAIRATATSSCRATCARPGRTLLYLLLGLPYGVAYLVVVGGGLLLGAVLSIAWIGLPLLAAVARSSGSSRRASDGPPTAGSTRTCRRFRARRAATGAAMLEQTGYRPFWRALAMLLLRLPVALAGLVVVARRSRCRGRPARARRRRLHRAATASSARGRSAPVVALALIVLAAAAAVLRRASGGHRAGAARARAGAAAVRAHGSGARARDAGRAARRPLAEHRLLAARPRDLRRRARPRVDLPRAGSGRAWTAVEREGNRVAAIVHDAELDATPELVHAAASAAALAIDNERLKADLRARSRSCATRAAASSRRRRRPPRDRARPARRRPAAARLARARPAAPARAAKHEPEVAATVEELADKLAVALAELRELARGIHPACCPTTGSAPPSTCSSSARRSPSSAT